MFNDVSELQSYIQAVNPRDGACFQCTQGPWRVATVVVGTTAGLKSLVRSVFVGNVPGTPLDLVATLCGVRYKELYAFLHSIPPKDLQSSIFSILPMDLLATVRAYIGEQSNLQALLVGTAGVTTSLTATLYAVPPKNLLAIIRTSHNVLSNLKADIKGLARGTLSLVGLLQPSDEFNIPAYINAVLPKDLSGYINSCSYQTLLASIQGHATLDLSVDINLILMSNLSMCIGAHSPANLRSYIGGWSRDNTADILATCQSFHDSTLGATINRYFYKGFTNLSGSINIIPLYLLHASVVGWAERDLSAQITCFMPPGWLRATINVHGGYKNLTSSIWAATAVQQISSLSASLSGWQFTDMSATISTIIAANISASISSIGGAKDISATIKVKTIIFNEFYKFSTVNTSDLRAYIGYSLCTLRTPKSAYAILTSLISSIPTYNLGATIEGYKVSFSGNRGLAAFLSYTNTYSLFSNFLSFKIETKVSDAIRPKPAFAKNSLNITFKIINGLCNLKSMLTSQPHNSSLRAEIKSKLLIVHGRAVNKVLTEELVEIEDYMKRWSANVDIYLNSESPIYYTDGQAFSREYGKPIFSILFKRKAASGVEYGYTLNQNMFFDSTDAAIRYGLLKVSGRMGMIGLQAKIQPIVKSLGLNVKIEGKEREPRYLGSPFTYLKSGSLSFMGTCINHIMYKSKTNIFGGIQDITSSIAAVPN